MFVRLNIVQGSIGKPVFYLLNIVIVAFWSSEHVERIIEFHIEREIGVVGERKFVCELFEPDSLKELSEEIDEMHDGAGDVAEFEEDWFRQFLQEVAKRFVEIDRASVILSVIYPDEHLSTLLESPRKA